MRLSLRRFHLAGALYLLAFLCAAIAGSNYVRGDGSTIIVTSTADSGPGSLRQAFADANDGDTIQFDPTLNGQTITLTSAELAINKSITISGPGPGLLRVSRNQQATNFRIFHTLPGHTVVVSGLTISNGQLLSVNGGGILNDQATLTMINCAISGNVVIANGSPPTQAGGGGIYNSGTLNLVSSTVSGNSATGPWSYGGGAIYNAGAVTITQSSISGNNGDMSGGGINNGGMLTMTDSTVSSNHTNGFGHGQGFGGGISNGGTLTIQNTTISGNSVVGEAGYGGGINGNSTITNSTISGNTARLGGGISGGGTITNSTISGNSSQFAGGGIFGSVIIRNSTISGNTATGFAGGGGIITNSTIGGNMPVSSAGGGIYGGGIITNSTISGNAATQGGGIYATSALQIGNAILKAGSSGANIFNNGGTVTSHGYNLSSDNGGGFLTAPGDQINIDPLLGPLQDNGGPTFTHALLPRSPAVNTGDPNFTPPPLYDQRDVGYDRVSDARLDIGSFEVQVPSPTPTPTPTPCLPTITQSSSQAITTGNSVSCNDGVTHTDNSYWRAFDMAAYAAGGQYCINSVSFGVEFANTTQPVTVRLYTTSNFPTGFPGSLTQIATTTLNVGSAQNGTVVTTPLLVIVPAGTPQLVMELFTPNGQPGGYRFFVGSNAALETGPSYFSAPTCGITTPATTTAIGFPNMHIVFDVNGTCTCPTPTPCPIFNVTGTVGQCTTAGPSGVALAGVTMTLTSTGQSNSTTTDSSGNYFLSGFSCVTNTVTPSKAALTPGSAGIDTVDVIAIQKHFLRTGTPLTGCRLTAADVNGAGGVNTVDVIATQKFFLGLTNGTANVGQYRFTPATRSYSPPISNQTAQNYDTVVVGDVAAPFVE
jgi:hypothetical protein